MSDIVTYDSLDNSDNLVDFLTKFTRFGIDQCLHFDRLIENKQQFIENLSTIDNKYEDKRVILSRFYFVFSNFFFI